MKYSTLYAYGFSCLHNLFKLLEKSRKFWDFFFHFVNAKNLQISAEIMQLSQRRYFFDWRVVCGTTVNLETLMWSIKCRHSSSMILLYMKEPKTICLFIQVVTWPILKRESWSIQNAGSMFSGLVTPSECTKTVFWDDDICKTIHYYFTIHGFKNCSTKEIK